jgi:BirA family biotin operon repressor/biotin-[acetyl-CoA-carboxylase] ligase
LLREESGTVTPPWMSGRPAEAAHVRVKWPNDVLIGRRKLCGILVEARAGLPRAVVGVGINVNNSLQDAPPEVRDRAVSLLDVSSRTLDRTDVLIRLLQHMESGLELLRESGEHLQRRWREHCALTGHVVRVETPVGPMIGRCHGIAEDGALLLQTERGTERVVSGVVTSYE